MISLKKKKKTFSDRLLVTTRRLSSNLASQPPQMAVYSDCICISLLVMFGEWGGSDRSIVSFFFSETRKIWRSTDHRDAAATNWASLFPSRCSFFFFFFIFVRVETAARRRPNPDAGQTATDQFHDTFIAFCFSQGDWRRPFEWTRRQLVSSELARSIAEPLPNVVVKVVVFFFLLYLGGHQRPWRWFCQSTADDHNLFCTK